MPRTFPAALALALACSRSPLPVAPAAVATSAVAPAAVAPAAVAAFPVAAAPREPALRGRVAEKIDAGQYTYLRLETPAGESWAAVPKANLEVGAQAIVLGAAWMENFTSATLSRTWPRIAFGTLASETPAAAPEGPDGAGGLAQPKVATREGRTIAEIYARRSALKGKRVAVRGKVVKAVGGVLGKTWLHLQDGTGSGPSADLAVTSAGTAKVGDVVVATGLVHLDRDLGSGYRYDILLEDAELKKE